MTSHQITHIIHTSHHSHLTSFTHHIITHHISPQKYENYLEKWTSKKLEEPETTGITRETRTRPLRPPGKYENYHEKRSWRAGNHENSHAKPVPAARRHLENTKITTKKEHRSTKVRYLRRNPFATSDLTPRPVTITVKTPSVKHSVWGKKQKMWWWFVVVVICPGGHLWWWWWFFVVVILVIC